MGLIEMLPFVTEGDAFLFLLPFSEIENLERSPLEAALLRSGEEPTDKRAVLRVDPSASEVLGVKYHPPNADWYWVAKVELVLSPVGYRQLRERGQVMNIDHSKDLCVQDENFVPGR